MDIAQKLLMVSFLAALLLYYGVTIKSVFDLKQTIIFKVILSLGITSMFTVVFYFYYMLALTL